METWLAEPSFKESVRHKLALCALWDDHRLWPTNLRIGMLLNPELRLTQRPPADSGEEMWRYYPLHHARRRRKPSVVVLGLAPLDGAGGGAARCEPPPGGEGARLGEV